MANQYDEDEIDDLDELEGADLIKNLRKQIRGLSKEKSELAQELSSLKTTARERSVADVLTAKGVSAKVAKFIPSDVEGEDAISAWLTENADVFGFTVDETSTTATNAPASEEVAAAQKIQSLGQSAITPSRVQDLETQLANAKDQAEIEAIWAQAREYFL